jgi:uncharacterized protein (TIGR02757 family)
VRAAGAKGSGEGDLGEPSVGAAVTRERSVADNRRWRRVRATLDGVRTRCDVDARREADPVVFVHRYGPREDKELAALTAACMAFGNAKVIVTKLADLFQRLGPSLARAVDDEAGMVARLRGWKHRVFVGDDVAWLLLGARGLQRTAGSLEAAFITELGCAESLREALAKFCDRIREAGNLRLLRSSVGSRHLLPDPRNPSGSKRLLLFLRWMGRPADGVDLGLWALDPARLLVPVDVHVHRLSRNLGLTERKAVTWETAEDITRALAQFDPSDPTKYDFSLCHMGMLRRCPSRRDARLCSGCGVKPVCVHWMKRFRRPV